MNTTRQQQGPQLPPRQEMIEARDSLKGFLNTKGFGYLNDVYRGQVAAHQAELAKSAESIGEQNPITFVLSQEYKKGVLQGIMVCSQMHSLLVEQLSKDIALSAEPDAPAGEQK